MKENVSGCFFSKHSVYTPQSSSRGQLLYHAVDDDVVVTCHLSTDTLVVLQARCAIWHPYKSD